MNRLLQESRDILTRVFVYMTLLFLFLSFLRDVILAFLPIRMDYLLVTILVILGLYEILDIRAAHASQRRSENGPESHGKKTGA